LEIPISWVYHLKYLAFVNFIVYKIKDIYIFDMYFEPSSLGIRQFWHD